MSTYNDYDAGSMVFDDLLFGIDVEVDYEITETWREDYEGDGSVPNGINRCDELIESDVAITGLRLLDHHHGKHVEIDMAGLTSLMHRALEEAIEERLNA